MGRVQEEELQKVENLIVNVNNYRYIKNSLKSSNLVFVNSTSFQTHFCTNLRDSGTLAMDSINVITAGNEL